MPNWEKFGKSGHTGHRFLYFFSSLTKAKKLDITNFSADNHLGQGVKPYLGNKILTNTCESFNFHLFGSVLSFLNGPSSANHYNSFNKYMWKMLCPSSVRHWTSNPQPLEHESSPIITRPVLPPIGSLLLLVWDDTSIVFLTDSCHPRATDKKVLQFLVWVIVHYF